MSDCTIDPVTRFWSKVVKTDTCWIWTGAKAFYGYGVLMVDGKDIRAHRYSYILHNGPIEDGLLVLHRCDNPPCVNPIKKGRGFTPDKLPLTVLQ